MRWGGGEGEGGVSEAGSCRGWDRPATSAQATAHAGSRRRHGATAAAGRATLPRGGGRGALQMRAARRGTAGGISGAVRDRRQQEGSGRGRPTADTPHQQRLS